jgi:hypothetical protein
MQGKFNGSQMIAVQKLVELLDLPQFLASVGHFCPTDFAWSRVKESAEAVLEVL